MKLGELVYICRMQGSYRKNFFMFTAQKSLKIFDTLYFDVYTSFNTIFSYLIHRECQVINIEMMNDITSKEFEKHISISMYEITSKLKEYVNTYTYNGMDHIKDLILMLFDNDDYKHNIFLISLILCEDKLHLNIFKNIINKFQLKINYEQLKDLIFWKKQQIDQNDEPIHNFRHLLNDLGIGVKNQSEHITDSNSSFFYYCPYLTMKIEKCTDYDTTQYNVLNIKNCFVKFNISFEMAESFSICGNKDERIVKMHLNGVKYMCICVEENVLDMKQTSYTVYKIDLNKFVIQCMYKRKAKQFTCLNYWKFEDSQVNLIKLGTNNISPWTLTFESSDMKIDISSFDLYRICNKELQILWNSDMFDDHDHGKILLKKVQRNLELKLESLLFFNYEDDKVLTHFAIICEVP